MGYNQHSLIVKKVDASYMAAYGTYPSTGKGLIIYPNQTDSGPFIKLLGTGWMYLQFPTGMGIEIVESGTARARIYETTPDMTFESVTANNNIYLKTAGTGKIKFGSYTGLCGEALAGYIEILDAAGNSRKLGVIA